MNRIDALFARLHREGRRALMPFITAGDPDLAATAALIAEMVARGAHMVEIGIPYSDPIADGPVITESYHRALVNGVKLDQNLPDAADPGAETANGPVAVAPIVTMVSYAIVHRHGPAAYLDQASASGVDGLIVPDLPVEESAGLLAMATERGLKLIQLVTPTTPRDRALRIANTTTGFLYYVSVAGLTGERLRCRLNSRRTSPGCGRRPTCQSASDSASARRNISSNSAPVADGLIVGSALVRRFADAAAHPRAELVTRVGALIGSLSAALEEVPRQTS